MMRKLGVLAAVVFFIVANAFPFLTLRADYRETWSKNPDIIRNSYEDYEIDFNGGDYTSDIFVIKPPAKFLQDRYTLGVAFTF